MKKLSFFLDRTSLILSLVCIITLSLDGNLVAALGWGVACLWIIRCLISETYESKR